MNYYYSTTLILLGRGKNHRGAPEHRGRGRELDLVVNFVDKD